MSLFGSLLGSFLMWIGGAGFQGTTTVADDGDLARLQGTWRIVSVECCGKPDNRDNEKYTLTFNGNRMTFRDCESHDEAVVKYRLDEKRCPKQIRFGTVRGIYEFKDDPGPAHAKFLTQ
jgi:uncharacterized protein (TIGR03067 family)